MSFNLRRAFVVILLAIAAFFVYRATTNSSVYRFPDLSGPSAATTVAKPVAAAMSGFSKGSDSRLAVLVTDPASDWLGLVHGLKSIGIPFIVTDQPDAALSHTVILAYPTISGKVLSPAALAALAAHPSKGGMLIGFEVLGGGFDEVFGFSAVSANRSRKTLVIDEAQAGGLALTAKTDTTIPLAGPSGSMPAYAFTPTTGKAVAHYDDGAVAVLRRDVGTGRAYAFGIDIGAYLAKAYNGRQDFGKNYINAYEPAVDTLLRILRQLYRSAEPAAVTIDTVPFGKSVSVIITHDIDYTKSIENAIRYAQVEREQGIDATFFIQTKYVRDWNDDIFFNQRGAELTRQVAAMGMEVASHSVSHSRVFSKFALGTGNERYPDYAPFVKSASETQGGTILGELRTSRFLLASAVPGLNVQSFRPGHLQYPFDLPQALEASGYRFSSSVSSGTAMTHLPFRLNYARENIAESAVFELPITIEDELQRPMTDRLGKAIDVLKALQAYGGMCVVLIHPDVFDDKLAFLKGFIAEGKKLNAWFGTIAAFGQWWSARDGVALDVQRTGDNAVLAVHLADAVTGLSLQVPPSWRLQPDSLYGGRITQHADRIQISHPRADLKLNFRVAN